MRGKNNKETLKKPLFASFEFFLPPEEAKRGNLKSQSSSFINTAARKNMKKIGLR